MKKILILTVITCQSICALGQSTTSYGVNAATNGSFNSYFGYDAGYAVGPPSYNVAFGAYAGDETSGSSNTFIGSNVASSNASIGIENTFIGRSSGFAIQSGSQNVFIGYYVGRYNTTGSYNTAIGSEAYLSGFGTVGQTDFGYRAHYGGSDTGPSNSVAFGAESTYNSVIVTVPSNTAFGYQTSWSNTHGKYNVAIGYKALFSASSSNYNTAIGHEALISTTTSSNSAIGYQALFQNNTGTFSTATGALALRNSGSGSNVGTGFQSVLRAAGGSTHNTGHGAQPAWTTAHKIQDYNTSIGYNAGPTQSIADLSNTTALGANTVNLSVNQVRIGNASVTSIGGFADWTNVSDGRFKKDVRADVAGLNFVNELRPVSYSLERSEINAFLKAAEGDETTSHGKSSRQTGFIGQEVNALIKAKGYLFNGVVEPKNENDHYGLKYAKFVVPLTKAVQELSARVDKTQTKRKECQLQIASLLNQLVSGVESESADRRSSLFSAKTKPVSDETIITVALPQTADDATVTVFNLEGQELLSLPVIGRGTAGVTIDANALLAGQYWYTLTVDNRVVDTKILVVTTE